MKEFGVFIPEQEQKLLRFEITYIIRRVCLFFYPRRKTRRTCCMYFFVTVYKLMSLSYMEKLPKKVMKRKQAKKLIVSFLLGCHVGVGAQRIPGPPRKVRIRIAQKFIFIEGWVSAHYQALLERCVLELHRSSSL